MGAEQSVEATPVQPVHPDDPRQALHGNEWRGARIPVDKCVQPTPSGFLAKSYDSRNLEHWASKGFSQYGADGIIHKLFSDVNTTNKFFVEFGVQGGKECNTRRLREACGWSGLLMDGGHENRKINLQRQFITRENIVTLLDQNSVPRALDLLSVDIDGNDFHVLNAILHAGYRPRVVIVETNFDLPEGYDATIRYAPTFVGYTNQRSPRACYHSASVNAFLQLARRYQYSIVGAHRPDLYWVRNDVLQRHGVDAYEGTNDVAVLTMHGKERLQNSSLKPDKCRQHLIDRKGAVSSMVAIAEWSRLVGS